MKANAIKIEHQGGFFVLWPLMLWNELSTEEQAAARKLLPDGEVVAGSLYRVPLHGRFKMEKLPDELAAAVNGTGKEFAAKRQQQRVQKSAVQVVAEIRKQFGMGPLDDDLATN